MNREEYLAVPARYIVLNPVGAGIAGSPELYAWSSYSATAGRQRATAFLSTDLVLSLFHKGAPTARRIYRRYVIDGIGVREEFRPNGGVILGDEAFVLSLERVLAERRDDATFPVRRRYADRPTLKSLLPAPRTGENGRNTVDRPERDESIYRAYVDYGYTQIEIARYLRMSRSHVGTIIKTKVEGLRAREGAAELGKRTLEE